MIFMPKHYLRELRERAACLVASSAVSTQNIQLCAHRRRFGHAPDGTQNGGYFS
jgi:hypothetical protein